MTKFSSSESGLKTKAPTRSRVEGLGLKVPAGVSGLGAYKFEGTSGFGQGGLSLGGHPGSPTPYPTA